MASIISAGTTSGTSLNLSGDTSGVLQLATNGSTTAVTVDTSQRVGIGTASPSFPLDISAASGTTARIKSTGNYSYLRLDNTSATGGGAITCWQNGSQKALFGVSGAALGDTSGDAIIYAETGQGIRFTTNGGTERMRIDSSGNVGIGTSSPSVKLEVNRGSAGSIVTFTDGVSTNFNFSTSGTVGTFGTDAGSTSLALKSSGAERMRITSGGQVGIGVTPAAWDSFTPLQISANGVMAANNFGGGNTQFFVANGIYYGSGAYRYLITGTQVGRYAINGGTHYLFGSGSGTAGNTVTETQLMQVSTNSTLALQGGTSSSGTGIAFPATQAASSDANTLDDYEEGTWTPSFSASGATFTYGSERGGWYTKIGRVVTVGFTLSTTARSGGSGAITITGLPFTSGSISSGFSAGSVGTVNQWAHSSSYTQWGIRVTTATTSIAIFEFGQAGAQAGDTTAQVAIIPTGTTTNSTLSITYYID